MCDSTRISALKVTELFVAPRGASIYSARRSFCVPFSPCFIKDDKFRKTSRCAISARLIPTEMPPKRGRWKRKARGPKFICLCAHVERNARASFCCTIVSTRNLGRSSESLRSPAENPWPRSIVSSTRLSSFRPVLQLIRMNLCVASSAE